MPMPLHIHLHQRLLFSRSATGEVLALHGSGEAVTGLLLKTPILYGLPPMRFPVQNGCYIWEGTLVEETEAEGGGDVKRFWPGSLQQVSPADLTDLFLNFGDQTMGQAILMATYRASFETSDFLTNFNRP